ncbi:MULTISPECIES: glycosyltransferase [Streptomyces]|uniref:Glycosyl transferase family 28 C-terminal domain-containing protein n=1 Tax=Streptomyces sp. NBC_00093 TaxID=2975649 RepID=A0AAU2A5H9_9ACTN
MIGYYVHHLGSGHVNRAAAIAARTETTVAAFSTSPPPVDWAGPWIALPDDAAVPDQLLSDVTAGGTLHWAPRRHEGLRTRMGILGDHLARGEIRLMVVDVSVEVSMFARLYGIPVIVVGQPGDRSDRPHRVAYDMAERLLAPWPEFVASNWPKRWQEKTVHLGAFSRFDDRAAVRTESGRRIVVMWGSGGLDIGIDDIRRAAKANPDWQWDVLGPSVTGAGLPNLVWHGWVDDVWSRLGAADIVVTHAGQNAIAEVAAARRPAIVVPQNRPHDEQHATATALHDSGIGVVATTWPQPEEWPSLLDRAIAVGGAGWSRWSPGDGAQRAATVLDELAA